MAEYYRKWTKADVLRALNAAAEQATALKESCLAARADLDLSEQGRNNRITALIKQMGGRVKAHLTTAADMVRNMRDRLQHEADLDKKRANDATHQLRIQNCVKALEMRGAVMSKDEFMELLGPIAFDITCQHVIKAAAGTGYMNSWQSGVWAVELFAPVLNRKRAIEQLGKLAEQIESSWDDKTTFEMVTGSEAALVFKTLEALLNHWNDELTHYN